MEDLSDSSPSVAGLIDAHCHPTERPSSLGNISSMKASKLITMSTNFEDISLVDRIAIEYPEKVIPAFGYHPWFSHLVYVGQKKPLTAREHYGEIITPEPSDEFIASLPQPKPLNDYLYQMRELLIKHPNAIVGEAGLDRSFCLPNKNPKPGEANLTGYKVTLDHQVKVLHEQLKIAAELNRPVSLHSVKTPQVMYDVLNNLVVPPPSICLHSYTGSHDFLKKYFYPTHKNPKPQRLNVFVSCSVLINLWKDERAVKMLDVIPKGRVLTESDFHEAGDQMDIYLQKSFEYIRKHYGWSVDEGIEHFKTNFDQFLMKR